MLDPARFDCTVHVVESYPETLLHPPQEVVPILPYWVATQQPLPLLYHQSCVDSAETLRDGTVGHPWPSAIHHPKLPHVSILWLTPGSCCKSKGKTILKWLSLYQPSYQPSGVSIIARTVHLSMYIYIDSSPIYIYIGIHNTTAEKHKGNVLSSKSPQLNYKQLLGVGSRCPTFLSLVHLSSAPLAGHPLVIPVTVRVHMLKAAVRVDVPAIIPLKTWASPPSSSLIAI